MRRTITVRTARDDAEMAAAQRLRIEVFCDEQGVPRSMELDGLDGEARRTGPDEVLLHGQRGARSFYERGGYVARSEEIINEAGIDHVAMRKAL